MAAKKFQHKFRIIDGPNRDDLFNLFKLGDEVSFRIFLDAGNERVIRVKIGAIKIDYKSIAMQSGYYNFFIYGFTKKYNPKKRKNTGLLSNVKVTIKYDAGTNSGVIGFY